MNLRVAAILSVAFVLFAADVALAAPRDSVRVVFATNRNELPRGDGRLFGSEFGSADPTAYTTGSILVRRVSDDPDYGWEPDDCTLTIDRRRPSSLVAFSSRGGASRTWRPGYGVVLLPGFAQSFKDALRRAAQVGTGYGAREVLVFSWPANGRVSLADYKRDRADAARSGRAMSQALEDFLHATQGSGESYRLVAHSMGAFALRAAVQSVRERNRALIDDRKPVFDTTILAAPDEDDDALSDERRLRPLTRLSRNVVVYRAGSDLPLAVSQIVNGRPRLGHAGPRNLPSLPENVSVVDASDVSETREGFREHYAHQYYRLSPRVISDARQVSENVGPRRIRGRMPFPPGGAEPRSWLIPFDANAAQVVR